MAQDTPEKTPNQLALDKMRADPKYSGFESLVNAIFDEKIEVLKKTKSKKKDATGESVGTFFDDLPNLFSAQPPDVL